MPERHVHVVL